MPPATFSVISGSPPFSVGGGVVVAEIFRGPRERTRFSGGGGGVVADSRNFSSPSLFSGGEGSGRNLFGSYECRSIEFPQFWDIFFTFPGHFNVTTSQFIAENKYLPKVWGGHGPRGPSGYATDVRLL